MLDDVGYTFAHIAATNPLVPVLVAIIIFLSPLLALRLLSSLGSPSMVLENLGLGFLLPWSSTPRSEDTSMRKLKKKKHRSDSSTTLDGSNGHGDLYPGLVNVSGTYCFMNSTLQALASLSYERPYLQELHEQAVALDVASPVIDALRETLIDLNTPHTSRRAIRPLRIIDVLSNPAPGQKDSMLFSSMQHQDAQELFQLVSECVKDEATAIEREGKRDRGLGNVLLASASLSRAGKGPFDGLTANRRSCVDCGYTEAVMHFAFDNLQLTVPPASYCRLEDCLADYTRLEVLTDCICRKCSMVATHERLLAEVARFNESAAVADGSATSSKKKRARATRRMEQKVKAALDEERIEEDIPDLKMERVFSSRSTKQVMIGRPPPVLALHLNRSMHFGTSAGKNNCRITFPEILDLTPFTTSGQLSVKPQLPISSPPNMLSRSLTPTPASYNAPRVLYRLSAVVCHYGTHSYGHYIAYRRKPPVRTPRMHHPFGCSCESCALDGPFRDSGAPWLRISDDNVSEVPLATVLDEQQGTFMLYYERIVQSRPPIASSASEETLKPPKSHSIEEEDDNASRLRSRNVARVVHAFERGSRSPEPRTERSSRTVTTDVLIQPTPSRPRVLEAIVSDSTVVVEYPDPNVDVVVATTPNHVEDMSSSPSVRTDTTPPETVTSDDVLTPFNGDAHTEDVEIDLASWTASIASSSSSRTSRRKGKVKRPHASPAVVDLRA